MSQTKPRQYNIINANELASVRNLKAAAAHMLLMLLVVFLTEMPNANADGLFDFQMKLAEKGNAEAQFKIGEMYETGFGTSKDMKLAEEWIAKAASQGHETAGFKQLYWDMKKNGITKENKAQYDALSSKASAENAYAQYYMGKLYAVGAGVPLDKSKSLDWYSKATLQGIVEAEREAALMREDVRRDEIAQEKAEQKRQEELKAKREEDKRKQEADRIAAQKKAEAEAAAAATKQSDEKRKTVDTKKADDTKSRQALEAQRAAEQQAEKQELEVKRQAILKQREESEKERKAEFESDPCSGKSARFLSTCR